MPLPDPDMAVKAIVAELASFHAEDVRAILDGLAGDERQTIEALLHEYAGGLGIAPGATGAVPDYDETELSPWLRQVLEKVRQRRSAITPYAQQALVKCVAALYPARRVQS